MPVTKEQAQMLTNLAIACRPYRAPTWDAPGVMAAIGQLKDWSLSEVALRVIIAAADREAQTPGVIATQQIPEPKPPLPKPNTWDPNEICADCSKPRNVCESGPRFKDDDHTFVSRAANPTTARPVDTARAVAALRDVKATEDPLERPEPDTSDEGTQNVAALRQALHPTTSAAVAAGNEE